MKKINLRPTSSATLAAQKSGRALRQPETPAPAVKMDCPFCSMMDCHDTTRLFSFGFQGMGICAECIALALEGWKNWRWADGQTCDRCNRKDVRAFKCHPQKMQGVNGVCICEKCLTAGQGHMSGVAPLAEPKELPVMPTTAERNSGIL